MPEVTDTPLLDGAVVDALERTCARLLEQLEAGPLAQLVHGEIEQVLELTRPVRLGDPTTAWDDGVPTTTIEIAEVRGRRRTVEVALNAEYGVPATIVRIDDRTPADLCRFAAELVTAALEEETGEDVWAAALGLAIGEQIAGTRRGTRPWVWWVGTLLDQCSMHAADDLHRTIARLHAGFDGTWTELVTVAHELTASGEGCLDATARHDEAHTP